MFLAWREGSAPTLDTRMTQRQVPTMTNSKILMAVRLVGACVLATTLACAGKATSSAPSPTKDPRVGLKAGVTDAGEALFGARMQAAATTPKGFEQSMNSDLA